MIWVLIKEVVSVLFWPKTSGLVGATKKKSFDQLLVAGGWGIVAFFLWVSIPHSIELILLYEHGDWALPKAGLMAFAIELIPSFTFLVGLHNQTLESYKRYTLMGLSVPFVALVLHLQYSYYFGPKEVRIWAIELAAVLPYGILVGTISIAFLREGFTRTLNLIEKRVREAEAAVEGRYRLIVAAQEEALEATRRELEESKAFTRNLINAPDPLREALEKELAATREELVALHSDRERRTSELTLLRDEREGLHEYIARLEKANQLARERLVFPREAVADLFRRMNPKVENLKKEEVLKHLETLWAGKPVRGEEAN
jgi:hypothetical protein